MRNTAAMIFLFFVMPFVFLAGCTVNGSSSQEDVENDIESIVFRNLDSGTSFVGDTACFDCHENQYRGFKEHGMANSMYLLTRDTAVEDFGSEVVVDSTTGLRYETVAADSGFFMVEYILDEEGKRVHELKRPMEYVVGSGTSARTYVMEEDGWFYELPVTWYTQKGRWDFSPGYRVANKRFDRKIADRCVACHNGYPSPVPQTNGMYTEMPLGISCERCHGPGQLHVEERMSGGDVVSRIDHTIVNPSHLELDLRLDVCQQCHLNGSVSLLREGRTPYDFRPSQELDDFVALFNGLESIDEEGISVISHADRMRMSACFTETLQLPKPLECTTCHDPHEGFRTEGPQYFNSTCMTCHSPVQLKEIDIDQPISVHTTEANCIDCHMPKADLIEAPHSSFTDHFIQVVDKDNEDGPVLTQEKDVLKAHFAKDQRDTPEARLYEGMAYITRGYQAGKNEAIEQGIAILEEEFSNGSTMSEAKYLLGYAFVLLGRPAEAIAPLEEALKLEPNKTERLNTLAQAYEAVGIKDASRIERLYREALRIQPKLSDVRLNLGLFLQKQGKLDAAESAYREVISNESWNALGWYNLGTLQLQQGKLDAAKETLEQALMLDPLSGPTMSNLGLILLQQERLDEAQEILETSVLRDKDHVESFENLGTLYLNLEENAKAIEMLSIAIQLNPNLSDIQAKLGLAFFRAERFDDARIAAQKAIALSPNHPLASQILQAL